MATPESLLQEEQAAEEALRQAYTQAEGTPESEEAQAAESVAEHVETAAVPESSEWEHKYQVLRGKYDAELPRAIDEARYWRDRCDQLQMQVEAAVQQHPASTEPAPAISQELNDYLGEDAAKVVAKLLDQQKRELEAKFGQVANFTRQSAEQTFWSQVRQAFPNYADMQNDSALNQWLNGTWPGSRQTRLQQAQALAQALDAEGFIGLLQAYSPAATPNKPVMPSPTPRRAAGSGTPPPTKPSVSPAGLEEYGAKSMNLKSQGRWQEAANLEKEFDAVVRERRIGV